MTLIKNIAFTLSAVIVSLMAFGTIYKKTNPDFSYRKFGEAHFGDKCSTFKNKPNRQQGGLFPNPVVKNEPQVIEYCVKDEVAVMEQPVVNSVNVNVNVNVDEVEPIVPALISHGEEMPSNKQRVIKHYKPVAGL